MQRGDVRQMEQPITNLAMHIYEGYLDSHPLDRFLLQGNNIVNNTE